jgi:hypothetical protein
MKRIYDFRVLQCPAEKTFELEEFLCEVVHDRYISVESVLQHMNEEYPEEGMIVLFLGDTDFVFLTGRNMKFIEEPIEGSGKVSFQMPEGWKYE